MFQTFSQFLSGDPAIRFFSISRPDERPVPVSLLRMYSPVPAAVVPIGRLQMDVASEDGHIQCIERRQEPSASRDASALYFVESFLNPVVFPFLIPLRVHVFRTLSKFVYRRFAPLSVV